MTFRVENSVWHAFDSLDISGTGQVPKTTLKVLTANLGTVMGVMNVEKGLQDHKSTPYLVFDDFMFYLNAELFSVNVSSTNQARIKAQAEDVCWLVCKHRYGSSVLSDSHLARFFRIYCSLAELIAESPKAAVGLDVREFRFLTDAFVSALGRDWDVQILHNTVGSSKVIPFEKMISLWESWFLQGFDPSGLQEAVSELYQTFVGDVIKKGFLLKRGKLFLTPWKEQWFVLTPGNLTIYTDRQEKERKGDMTLDGDSSVLAVTSESPARPYRLTVTSGDKHWELSAQDHRTKLQWVTAIETAIQHSGSLVSYQKVLANKRRDERMAEERQEAEAERVRLEQLRLLQVQQSELVAERLARTTAETQVREEATLLEQERQRRQELEVARKELERLLEQERQAKRDEEIVRTLQARVLREEWEKREELEHLQDEQQKMLETERHLRVNLEQDQAERDAQLQDAKEQLEWLQEERRRLDGQLKGAWKVALEAERARDILESKLRDVQERAQSAERAKDVLEARLKARERASMIPIPVRTNGGRSAGTNTLSDSGGNKRTSNCKVPGPRTHCSDSSEEEEDEDQED